MLLPLARAWSVAVLGLLHVTGAWADSVAIEADGSVVGAPPKPVGNISWRQIKVQYMNLDRREDRRKQLEGRLKAIGWEGVAERFRATDGRQLKHKKMIKRGIITEEGYKQLVFMMGKDPTCSSGGDLTAGAVGLLHSWHRWLQEIRNASTEQIHLMLEDDVEFAPNFSRDLDEFLNALQELDKDWDLASIGWLTGHPKEMENPRIAKRWPNIGKMNWIAGTQGVMVHGSKGAGAIFDTLFPVGPWGQLDVRIRGLAQNPANDKEKALRLWCTKRWLVTAQVSKAAETDIQTCDR